MLCHTADQTHEDNPSKMSQGRAAMDAVDSDRAWAAVEANGGYEVRLGSLRPLSCTPKNNLLVGFNREKLRRGGEAIEKELETMTLEK